MFGRVCSLWLRWGVHGGRGPLAWRETFLSSLGGWLCVGPSCHLPGQGSGQRLLFLWNLGDGATVSAEDCVFEGLARWGCEGGPGWSFSVSLGRDGLSSGPSVMSGAQQGRVDPCSLWLGSSVLSPQRAPFPQGALAVSSGSQLWWLGQEGEGPEGSAGFSIAGKVQAALRPGAGMGWAWTWSHQHCPHR